MSKKKKFKKLAESNIQMLKSGKIKVSKDQKIDISSFVSKSIEDTVISRLDAIISKEDVKIDTADLHPNVTTNLLNPVFTAELSARCNNPVTETIIIPINKKASLNVFDYLGFDTLGVLLRASTLASVYKKVKPQWVELNNEDGSQYTNVLYIPGVMVFLDFESGKIRKTPFKVNILLIAVPSQAKMNENGIEKATDEEACSRIIADMVDAAIKCGCKNLIIDPFSHKKLDKDVPSTSKLWNQIVTSQRYIENINSTVFAIEDEDKFVIFNSNKLN